MSKMKLLLDVVDDIRRLADSLQTVADTLVGNTDTKDQSDQQPAPQPETNVFEALERLAKLHDAGALTDEEFAQKKAEMLSKL